MSKKIEELGLSEDILIEVQKIIQGAEDRVRTEYTGKLKDLEQYRPVEKTDAEIALEARIKDLETRENAIKSQENLSNINAKLTEKGLPLQLAKFLQGVEDIDTSMEDFTSIFADSKLNGSFKPSQGTKDMPLSTTKEQFSKMGYNARAEMLTTNPVLYKTLTDNN